MNALRRLEPLLYEETYSTARLVARARAGNRDACDELIRLYAPALRAFLQRRVGADSVEDVLQETCIAAYMTLSKFHGRARFKVWLFGIAHHKCADHFRSRGSAPRDISFEETELDPPAAGDAYARVDLRMMVADLLETLPPVQSEVLELYYFGDLTLAEIASVLGRSTNTVKAQFYRGHAAAARALPADASSLSFAEALGKQRAMEGVNLG